MRLDLMLFMSNVSYQLDSNRHEKLNYIPSLQQLLRVRL